jgi:hypothetical protein
MWAQLTCLISAKSEKHPTANRKATMAFLRIVLANANTLGLELVHRLFTYLNLRARLAL